MTTPSNGHGGYRKPSTPAPVSGPGALSARTDGNQPMVDLPDAGYGQQAQWQSIMQGAPLSNAGIPSPGPTQTQMAQSAQQAAGQQAAQAATIPAAQPVPLTAPTQRPDEPVTAGAPLGPGPGATPVAQQGGSMTQLLSTLSGPDITGEVAALLQWASQRGL